MERVKPVYLSRTYGIPLPNIDNPTEGWTPEDFLDKLARMKGRLLKHGEPDLDSVAKIVLSDWVRGRIPFFVSPPERSEELNAAEAKVKAKMAKAKEVKSRWKTANEDGAAPGVRQNLGSIMQKNTFVPEDIQPLDVEFAGIEEESSDEHGATEEEEEENEEEEMTWGDVFEGIKDDTEVLVHEAENSEVDTNMGEGVITSRPTIPPNSPFPADISSSEDGGTKSKVPRMKTNKVYFKFICIWLLANFGLSSSAKLPTFTRMPTLRTKIASRLHCSDLSLSEKGIVVKRKSKHQRFRCRCRWCV